MGKGKLCRLLKEARYWNSDMGLYATLEKQFCTRCNDSIDNCQLLYSLHMNQGEEDFKEEKIKELVF